MDIEDLQNKTVTIENYQSTFLTLKYEGNTYCLNFINKREFLINKGEQNKFIFSENHPLLLDYSENLVTVFINSKPENSDSFINEISAAIDEVTKGWRNWKNYATENGHFSYETFTKNVSEGSGRLLIAPFSIVENILNVCEKNKVSVTMFDNHLRRETFKLMNVGNSFVIAKDFKIQEN